MADTLDCDILPKDQLGGEPLGVLTKGLLLLWQSTPLSRIVLCESTMHDGNGVIINDTYHMAGEFSGY
jgi:hypothetical protein